MKSASLPRYALLLAIALAISAGGLGIGAASATSPSVGGGGNAAGGTPALVLLSQQTDMTTARVALEEIGMQVSLVLPPRVLIGRLPDSGPSGDIPDWAEIHTAAVDEASIPDDEPTTLAAVRYFNGLPAGGTPPSAAAEGLTPLVNDVRQTESPATGAAPGAPALSGTSDEMLGTVSVVLFFVQSIGAESEFTWNSADVQATLNQSLAALTWWSQQAAAYGKSVSFTVFYYGPTSPQAQTQYEPVRHDGDDAYLWIGEIMSRMGYNPVYRWYDAVTQYNADVRAHYCTDWAYSVFVGYNPYPAPDHNTDGLAGWAYWGGPLVNMLFRTFQWPFETALAHETGHIFTACDEYWQPDYGGCTQCSVCGASASQNGNGNCARCNPNSVDCLMNENSPALCPYTVAEVGWGAGGTVTPTVTRTPTRTRTPSATPSPSPSVTPSLTATGTKAPSTTPASTPTPSKTSSPAPTATPTASRTPTVTATLTATRRPTRTAGPSPTWVPGAVARQRLPGVARDWQAPAPGRPTATPTLTTHGVQLLPNHSMYVDSLGWLHVVGEVYNGTPSTLRYVRLRAALLDSVGQQVAIAEGYASVDALAPGRLSCFQISSGPVEDVTYYELVLVDYFSVELTPPDLSALDVTGAYDPSMGWYRLTGQMRNDSGGGVASAGAVGTLYDAAGRVVGCARAPLDQSELVQGESSPFEITFMWRDYRDVITYRVQGQAEAK